MAAATPTWWTLAAAVALGAGSGFMLA